VSLEDYEVRGIRTRFRRNAKRQLEGGKPRGDSRTASAVRRLNGTGQERNVNYRQSKTIDNKTESVEEEACNPRYHIRFTPVGDGMH